MGEGRGLTGMEPSSVRHPCLPLMMPNSSSSVLSEAVDQFKLHRGVNVGLKDIFDHVIFTSNITYTGGTFKSGMYSPDVHDKLTNSC